MAIRVRSWLVAKATGRNVVAAVVLAVVVGSLFTSVGPWQRVLEWLDGLTPLEMRFGYDADDVAQVLTTLGEEGRPRYRTFLLVDLFFPFFYALPLALLIVFFLRRAAPGSPRATSAAFVPLLSGVADLVENGCLLILLGRYPAPAPSLGAFTGVVTAAKLGLVYASVAIFLAAFLWWLIRRLRGVRV